MKILFVDDEPNILQGLKRMLRPYRAEWEMDFVENGQTALRLMAESPYDVVVSDVRMPGMDGVELLGEVQARHPTTIRIILSGHADERSAIRAVGPAHQYLSKPCEAGEVKATIERAVTLRNRLRNGGLQQLVSRMSSLPSLPALYERLMQELRSEEPSIRTVANIVAQDVAMTAKVLQMVNSAFFGLSTEISNPERAVMHLGTETVRALALSSGVFSQCDGARVATTHIESLWPHSVRTAALAKAIARAESAAKDVEDACYIAGLLHDVGKLVLALNEPDEFAAIAGFGSDDQVRAEREEHVFAATHADVGGYLLGIWGLPDIVVEAVTFHHDPSLIPADRMTPVLAVHAADAIDQRLSAGGPLAILDCLDAALVDRLGLASREAAWMAACRQLIEKGVNA